ncbi:MAG: replication initiation factor domain-containing protein, partial [Microcystaceae cyanobacterium]
VGFDFIECDRVQKVEFCAPMASPTGLNNIPLNLKKTGVLLASNPLKDGHNTAKPEERMEAGIDWLRFTATANEHQYRALVMRIFPGQGESFWVNNECHIKSYPSDPGYNQCDVGERGTKLALRRNQVVGGFTYDWALTLPGQPLEKMGLLEIAKLILWLVENFPDLEVTRCDYYLDDFTKSLNPVEIANALHSGSYRGFKKKVMILSDSGKTAAVDCGRGFNGFTANLGSRRSDTYVRIYDTKEKHGYDAMRIERETKGAHCKAFFGELKKKLIEARWIIKGNNEPLQIEFINNLALWLGSVAVGSFDFINRENVYGNGCLKECPMIEWWEKFKAHFDKITVRIPKVKPSLQRTFNWLNRQVKG